MLRLFTWILFLFAAHGIIAQQFSVLYDFNDFANGGTSIVKSPSGYFTTNGGVNLNTWRYSVLAARFGNNGDLIWNADLTDENDEWSHTLKSNSCVMYQPMLERYWVLCNYHTSEEITIPSIIFFNDFGEIIDTVIMYSMIEHNLLSISVCQSIEANYILCQPFNSSSDFLIKCDLDGNYLSHFTSNIGVQSDSKFITDVGDGLIIGGRYLPSGANNISLQYVRKFDYEGNVLWTNQYNNNGLSTYGALNALPLNNGNVLFASTATSGLELQERYRPLIGEIDNATGDTLWTKRYFSQDSIYRLHNFKRLSSGEYIGLGETRQPLNFPEIPFVTTAFIFKLDNDFNLLWKRVYTPIGFASNVWPHPTCHLNDFVENEDGGITALGMAFTYTGTGLQSGYIQDSWLLRVDSEGCLVSGCAVDITEHENTKHLFVYPNPATDRLNIQFPHIDKWQVSIYNMQGALVKEEQPNQLVQYSINIQELPSGIYALICINGEQQFTKQFIKH